MCCTLLAKLFLRPEVNSIVFSLRKRLLFTVRLNTSTGLPVDTILLLKWSLQMTTEPIHVCPSPSKTRTTQDRNINLLSISYAFKGPHLRVASPAHDERGGGNLGHTAVGILTQLTLLIPAFVLLTTPPLTLQRGFTVVRTLPYRSREARKNHDLRSMKYESKRSIHKS